MTRLRSCWSTPGTSCATRAVEFSRIHIEKRQIAVLCRPATRRLVSDHQGERVRAAHFATALFVLLSGSLTSSSCAQDDEKAPTIKIGIKAERFLQIEKKFNTSQHADVHGDQLVQQKILIDPEDHGIANVVVWTPRGPGERLDGEITKEAPTRHSIEIRNHNFWPRVIVAEFGDVLRQRAPDEYGTNINVGRLSQDGMFAISTPPGGIYECPLNGTTDRVMYVSCSIHPRMDAHIFIMRETYAAVTNENGECELTVWAPDKAPFVEVHLWHPYLGKLKLAKAADGVEEIEDGRIRVSPDADEVEIMVQVEERHSHQR